MDIRQMIRKNNKYVTVINGFEDDIDIKKLCRALKKSFKCGGNISNNKIHLQGDHTNKVKEYLIETGVYNYL